MEKYHFSSFSLQDVLIFVFLRHDSSHSDIMNDLFTLQDAVRMSGPRTFNIMIKPTGSSCNLDCSYCYYLDKAVQYGGREAVMSQELLEILIRQYCEACEAEELSFCWHGGEPLLMGIDFFRQAVQLESRYADGRKINNSIQTNGTLINAHWCRFFAKNHFLVGISLDGPKDIHDAFRLSKSRKPTFDKVMEAVRLMRVFGVEFNTLSVVHERCEGRGAEIYRFFRDVVKSKYQQYLPAVEHVVDVPNYHRPVIVPPEREGARLAPWSISAKGYGQFLCDIFDQWSQGDVGRVFVQMFDATLAGWCGVPGGLCSMGETCGDSLTVEHNGDVYCCDHFVYPHYLLGNIREQSLASIFDSAHRVQFGLDKRNSLPAECLKCEWYRVCHGECPKHRFAKGSDGKPKNYLCEGLRAFYAHVAPAMHHMAAAFF